MLGELTVEGADVRSLRSRKARTMLRILALEHPRPVSVDRLADCLWGDEPPAQPEREVAVAASRLRGLLGTERVVRGDGGYAVVADWVDAHALEELAAEARRRLERGDNAGARATAEAAVRLVNGVPLAGEADAAWVDAARASLDRTIVGLRLVAAEAALIAGGHGDAIDNAAVVLDADPYDEAALRIAMRGHVLAGRPASALALYATVRQRLAEDLGASPSPETEALHTAIVRDEPAAGLAPAPAPAHPGLPGRSAYFDLLDSELMAAGSGARVVVLEGEPGVGKTRLATDWSQLQASRGTPVLMGRCDEIGSSMPFQPVIDAVVAHLRHVGPEMEDGLLADDRSTLAPWLGLERTDLTDLTALPGQLVTTEAARTLVFSALLRVFDRLAASSDRTVVLLLDDVHLADASTVAWLSFVEHRGGAPLLVVATRRSGEAGPVPGRVHEVVPLDLDAARLIVGDERAEELWARSGGNPLLLVELAAAGAEATDVPRTVRESVDARCRRLGDAAHAVRAAAVLGRVVDLDLVAEVMGRPPLDVLDDLEAAVERSFLEDDGGRFVFRHELVREALVAGTSSARCTLLHRAAVAVLDQRRDADARTIAHHAIEAGDASRAARALVEASRIATARHDLAAAEALLDQAVELGRSAAVYLARGRVRLGRSDLDGAEGDALLALEHGAGAAAWELRAWAARYRHDMESAIEYGTRGMDIADDDVTRASCLVVTAFAHRGIGDLRRADEALSRAAEADRAGRLGLPSWTGVLRVHQGRVDEGLSMLEPAVGAPPDVLHGFWREHVLQMTVHALGLRGRVQEALRLVDQLRDEIERRGSVQRYRGLDDVYRSWLLNHLGSPAAADSAEAARACSPAKELMTQATLDLAAVATRDRRIDDAAAWIDEAREAMAEGWFHNRWRCEQRAAFLSARLHLEAGETDEALEVAASLESQAGARGDRRYETLARLVGACATLRGGQPVDPEAVDVDLGRLDEVASLESWWLTAEVAAASGEPRWWRLAEERVARLAGRSGSLGDGLRDFAGMRFDALGR